MDIAAEIDYWGSGVATFDPEKVLWRLKEEFPDAVIDTTDWADREVDSVDAFLAKSSPSPETMDAMRRQIRGKARRNGPVYKFKLADSNGAIIEGMSSRYRVAFHSAKGIEDGYSQRITDFLRSLGLGHVIARTQDPVDP